MSNPTNISFSVQKVAILAIMFSAFCTLNSFAQGEDRSRNIPESRVDDNFGAMESPEANVIEYNSKSSASTSANKDKATPTTVNRNKDVYKQAGEKDVRKENVSTLSFNLFLYIVDKFKED